MMGGDYVDLATLTIILKKRYLDSDIIKILCIAMK